MGNVFATAIRHGTTDAMEKLISQLPLPKDVRSICIKLNLCEYRARETGATTDPLVLDPLLSSLRKRFASASIYLVENDATGVNADNIFSFLGLDAVAKRHAAFTLNVAHDDWIEKSIDGMRFRSIEVPSVLQKCDLFITHPKLKTHGATKISCGLKNQFGLLKRKNKLSYHSFLDEAIVDANLGMTPHLSIVDANICMEGNGGPIYGTPKELGLLIGGADLVAVDAFCSALVGFRPYFVGHIRKAAKKKIGKMKFHPVADFDLGSDRYHLAFSTTLRYALKLARRKLARSR